MTLKELGLICQEYRKMLGYDQRIVADYIGCTPANISAFENGRNNNALIFAWYVRQGLYDDGVYNYIRERVKHD